LIVPMKKIHLIVQKKDIISALDNLRDLGTVHVEHQEALTGYQLTERREEVNMLKRVIDVLRPIKSDIQQEIFIDWTELVNKILKLLAEIDHYKESIAKRQMLINRWEPWGDFDPQEIEELASRGVYLQLCEVPAADKDRTPPGVILKAIYTSAGIARCVAISKGKIDLPFEVISPPAESSKRMIALQKEENKKIQEAQKILNQDARYLTSLEDTLRERQNVLEFEEIESGMREEEELALLKGFCPVDSVREIAIKAKDEHWGLLVEDPSEDDRVPTLIRNPRWVGLVKPLFGMMNIVPGYKELDISLCFLLFFSVFVGMLIGDAGYGLIFFAAALWAHKKYGTKFKDKSIFYLIYVLSICTFIWGLLTGTFLGQAWLPSNVKPLLPWLRESENVQLVCFVLGSIHLSIAHIWRGILRFPSFSALAEFGWFLLVWGMFFLIRVLILGATFPPFAKMFFVVGPLLVILFTKPSKNILKGIGPGLGGLLQNLINTFTDILSYIRLFAVGLATVAVADAFNQMAANIGFSNFFTGLGTAIILISGHLFNIILCSLAVIVHGVRLNVLEFSGHLNMEWTGYMYNPFKRIKGSEI
jgi:V/A-type H+/Na+-transporting ATPase subunit I